MQRLIDANELLKKQFMTREFDATARGWTLEVVSAKDIEDAPTIDPESLRPHGRWILEAHDERVDYRWNVTAECSECCDERKEIWAGFFPSVPPSIARGAALVSAENAKLSNYCPNCGAKMDKEMLESEVSEQSNRRDI